ncbi:TauD/TfdA family dioxygenase [Dactylosporangium sp. CA-139114]|uniref:TauD/TfdA family dioxygenase n=1 Tax=Dactylosporangium sp. CA-139114 TaxID=3239931 RepID=UPI003D97CA63
MADRIALTDETAARESGTPAVWRIDASSAGPATVAEWLAERRERIVAALHRDGALLLRGFPLVATPEQYATAIVAALPHLRDYVGGTSPRTRLHGRIMTATETPPDWSIPLHQEMAYTSNGPHRIAFLCLEPASGGGGLSLLGDMGAALGALAPDVRAEFEARGLRLRRVLPSRDDPGWKAGVKKSWQEVFDTGDRDEVGRICADRGWDADWIDDTTLRLTQETMAATRVHPVTGRTVWHNQAHFFAPASMIAWAARDGRAADERALRAAYAGEPHLVDNVVFGDGEPVPAERALAISATLAALERGVALERGDVLIVDNILTAHGRSAFRGERRLLVALADEPAWRPATVPEAASGPA